MDNPFGDEFWLNEDRLLELGLTNFVIDLLIASGEAGVALIPRGYATAIAWDAFNSAAVAWARMYFGRSPLMAPGVQAAITAGQPGGWGWAAELNRTTRRQFLREFEAWSNAGEPLPLLESRIAPFFGQSRAGRIAATETTRIFAAGNTMAWQASGVVQGKIWQTARDHRVCPVCGPLHNTMVELSGGWQFTDAMLRANPALAAVVKQPVMMVAPPAHVSCRCWLKPVVFDAWEPGELEKIRWQATV